MDRETKIDLLEALVCHSRVRNKLLDDSLKIGIDLERAILNGKGEKFNKIEAVIADVVFDRGSYEYVTQEENMYDLILWSKKSDRAIAKELMKRYEDGLKEEELNGYRD